MQQSHVSSAVKRSEMNIEIVTWTKHKKMSDGTTGKIVL